MHETKNNVIDIYGGPPQLCWGGFILSGMIFRIQMSMTKLRHIDDLGTARFITFSCYQYRRLLFDDATIKIFLSELENARTKYDLFLLGYVVMPNHVHIAIYPKQEVALGPAIGMIKGQSGKKIIASWRKSRPRALDRLSVVRSGRQRYAFWQKRCYDHNCRTTDAVREKIHYCHMNPVKAGLVNDPGDWPWSSYNWYQGDRDSIIHVDDVQIP